MKSSRALRSDWRSMVAGLLGIVGVAIFGILQFATCELLPGSDVVVVQLAQMSTLTLKRIPSLPRVESHRLSDVLASPASRRIF